jgi:hypothetical protein
LKNRDIHSTFFIEKDWAKKYLSSIDQILYDGNEIGYLDLKETELLYDETFDSIFIANFATSTKPFYRSYKTNELELIPILEKNGTKLILWSLNGDDYKSNLNEIEEITSAGDIIRFDCSDIRMIDFLPDYILYLKENNLNPVKVSELF